MYLYNTNLRITDSEIAGFNTGICTYGDVDIQGSTVIAKRGILTKDASQGTATQKYQEYSVGLLNIGHGTNRISLSETKIEANTITLNHIRGFAIISCPDATIGANLKLNKSGATPAKSFLAEGQQFYAKNVGDEDTYVNGTVYINDGTPPEETLRGYVEYYLGGSDNADNNKSEYELNENGGYLEIDEPTAENAEFMGWYYDEDFSEPAISDDLLSTKSMNGGVQKVGGKSTRISTRYAEYTELYAKFRSRVNYVLNGGVNNANNPSGYVTGETIVLKDPTRKGYKFEGWYSEATFKTKVTAIDTSEIGATVYAKWSPVKYQITYNLNSGKNNTKNPTTYTVETPTITLQAPTKANYKFDGWFKDSSFKTKITTIAKGTTGNIAVYAKWTPEKYQITYKLDGGKNNTKNPASYTVESATIKLTDPTKTGYTFAGWYKDSKFKSKITSIAKGTTGNITVYAKWTAIKYTVKFNANGGKGTMKAQSFTYDKAQKLTKNSFKNGKKKFIGWALSKADAKKGKVKYKNNASVKNLANKKSATVTLYAVWK